VLAVVEGLEPGEGLVITILEISPASWAWTANIPGFGLLADDFLDAHLWISKVEGGRVQTPIGIDLEARPMVGTIGVAPATQGPHPILVRAATAATWTSASWRPVRSSTSRCWS